MGPQDYYVLQLVVCTGENNSHNSNEKNSHSNRSMETVMLRFPDEKLWKLWADCARETCQKRTIWTESVTSEIAEMKSRGKKWVDPVTASTIYVKISYSLLFTGVLLVLLWMAQMGLKSPWGRMMRAIRDNEVASEAMGKDVTRRHLQIFVLGSAICGIAGAMMTTLDGQLTPGTYNPLRFTFLIWVMVVVGGSGNNFGAVLGGIFIWFFWIKVEPMGTGLINMITSGMANDSALKLHLLESTAHMRLFTMGLILLLVLRFSPRGLIPEK